MFDRTCTCAAHGGRQQWRRVAAVWRIRRFRACPLLHGWDINAMHVVTCHTSIHGRM